MTLKEKVLDFLNGELASLEDVRIVREAAGERDDGTFKAMVDLLDNVRRDVAGAVEPLKTHYAHAIHDAGDLLREWLNNADKSIKPELLHRADRISEWLRGMRATEQEASIQNTESGRRIVGRRWCFPDETL
jgi:hypothetical protein